MKQRRFSVRHRNLLLGALGCIGLLALLHYLALLGLGIPCPFQKLTGYLCPGCGNTRAALALLRLDIWTALQYNPLFPVEFFYLGWILFHCSKSYLSGKSFSYRPSRLWLDISLLTLLLLWWPLRNILGL